jgi:hypothetical protein
MKLLEYNIQTLDDGEKIESKNPEVDDGCESMEPKSSEVKEEDDEEEESNCFLPSIIFIQPLKQTNCSEFYVKIILERNINHRP